MLNGNDIDQAGSGVEKAGNGVKEAANGLSKLLESLGKFFGFVGKYWKGLSITLVAGLIVFQWYWIGSRYDKGYLVAKKEDKDYINTLELNNEFKDKRILILQKENDTLFKMWNECKQTSYSNITIKTKQ